MVEPSNRISIARISPLELPSLLRRGDVRISVIGLGRIGLPTATLFGKAGAKVIGIDVKKSTVENINAGICNLVDEPGLQELLNDVVKSGNLSAVSDPTDAFSSGQVM